MIEKIILQYLSNNKRLVIPGFGTLIKKDTGGIVFIELLKKDDHVLTSLLKQKYSTDEAKIRDVVAGFINSVINGVKTDGSYFIEGLGVMYMDESGVYELKYDPSAKKSAVPAPKQVLNINDRNISTNKPVETELKKEVPAIQKQETKAPVTAKTSETTPPTPLQKAQEPKQAVVDDKEIVKDLRYQKPIKQNDYGKKKKADLIMIIAILAALIAIASMIFGLMINEDPVDQMRSTHPTESVEQSSSDSVNLQ